MRTRTARLCVALIALFAIGCSETPAPPTSPKAAPPPTEYGKQGKKPPKGAPIGPEGVVP